MLDSLRNATMEILLVEDDPADVRLTQEAFREGQVDNRMAVANDGVEALAYLRREGHYADAAAPDLILLDLNMPRMDGRELLDRIKNDDALMHIPVVVLTTSDAETDIVSAYKSHANCYITKPFNLSELVEVIRSIESFWLRLARLP